MGIAKIYNQKQSGLGIRGIIEDYYVYAGEKVSAGDFVEFINGFSGNLITAPSNSVAVDTVKNSGDTIFAVSLDDNRVFIAYRHYASGDACLCGIVCTIENEKILVGTVTILHASNTINFVSALYIMKNKVFVAYDAGSNDYLYGVVCNIDGITITHGTNTQISTTSSSGRNGISTMLLDSGKIFIIYGTIFGIVCTINNTTISFGTQTAISSQNTTRISAVGIGNNRAFVAHSASSSVMGAVCTITNTTIAVNVDTSLISGTNSGSRINTLQLDNDKVIILHSYDSSYFLYGMVCKVVNNAITTGTDTTISSITSSAYVEPSACLLEDGIFVGFGGGSAIHGVVCSINELEMVTGTVKTLSSDVASIVYTTSVTLPYNNVFMAHVYGSNYHLYAQIFGTSNKTPSNNVTVPVFETQVRKSTTSDIYGVAKTSGMGAYRVVEYTIPEGESVSEGETREYSVEGDLAQGDIIPKNWTEVTPTEYVAEDGTKLTTSGVFSTAYAYKACDGNDMTWWNSSQDSNPAWAQLKFPTAITITKMIIGFRSTSDILSCVIQGSNDGLNWTELHNYSNFSDSAGVLNEVTLEKTMKATYYRISVTKNLSYWSISEWQVSEYIGKNLISGTALQSGTAGDTIQIAIPISDEESTGHNDIVSIYQPISAFNLVVNGDFEDGLEGWVQNNSTVTTFNQNSNGYSGKCAKIEVVTPQSNDYAGNFASMQNGVNVIESHVYYISCYCKGESVNYSNMYSCVGIYDSRSNETKKGTSIYGNSTTWSKTSYLYTATRTASDGTIQPMLYMLIGNSNGNITAGMGMYFDNVKMYDLTKMYGAGKEPTQEWCDANL